MWRTLIKNWPMKLLALALAVLVWLYANSVVVKTTEIGTFFEVSYPGTVDVAVKPANRRVKLTLSGPAGAIAELSRWNVKILYGVSDAGDLSEGRVDKIHFDQAMVTGLPPQVQVVRFIPAVFELTVRPLATTVFPVNPPQTVGKPAPGYGVGRTGIRGRAVVTVTGPAAVLKRMKKDLKGVDPEPVDVTNRSESVIDRFRSIRTTVQLDNTTVERIHCDDLVEVFVEIKRADATGVVKAVPISVLADPDFAWGVEITSSNPVDLTVEGPSETLKNLKAEHLHAFIDVRKRKPDKDVPFFEKLVVHGLPEGVRLTKEEELTVTAKFKLPTK